MSAVLVTGASARLAAGFDESKVTPGLAGFLVFAALVLATWLLLRSFTKQLGKVRFEERPPGEAVDAGAPAEDAPGRRRS